ncbi:protein CIP2A homolog [Tiliqua scincoides]|uniref:protein CIP2A homolog n=1 Tax=Tiliqua scincoides TaxID=71010 RepID=UPI0034636E60
MKDDKMGDRWKWCKNCALVIAIVLALTFLSLFLWKKYSEPGSQSGECQTQLQNQTIQVWAQLETCTEALKKDRDKAKKESDDIRAQLLIATQSLSNSSQHWDSCRKELYNLQSNIMSQNKEISKERAEKHKLQEEIKQLRQQISEWENQKKQEPSKGSGATIPDQAIILRLLLLPLLLL